jgi:VanZ family protein
VYRLKRRFEALSYFKAFPRIKRLAGWAPVRIAAFIVTLAAIYFFGTGTFSMARTRLLVDPILHHLYPGLGSGQMYNIIARMRWTLHSAEYFVVFILLAVWPLRLRPLTALIVTIALAAADEGHQYFLPDRTCDLFDLQMDATGAMAAFLLTGTVRWLRRGPADTPAALARSPD